MSPELQLSALLHTAEDALNQAEVVANENGLDFEFRPKYGPKLSYDGRLDDWNVIDIDDWYPANSGWNSSSYDC